MSIKRDYEKITDRSITGVTSAPQDDNTQAVSKDFQTPDSYQIDSQYSIDAQSNSKDLFTTGAMLPKDMTVRLVRAESANWETFLSVLYSITLTLFGVFAGSWMTSDGKTQQFTALEKFATISFAILSIGLIVTWIILKIRQQKRGVRIPVSMLDAYGNKTEQAHIEGRPKGRS